MNLFPLISRSKKTQTFSNPLNGLIFYSDPSVFSTRKPALSTISYNETTPKKEAATSTLKTKSHIKMNSSRLDGSLQKIELQPIQSSKIIKSANVLDSSRPQFSNELAETVRLTNYIFPEVEIVPLHLINNYHDIAKYKLHISLQKYFKLYFGKGIRHSSLKLNGKLEKYIPLLKKYDVLDREIIKKKWPKEFWEIKTTEELITWMQKYQKPSEYWTRYVLILIQLYCTPHPSIRKSTLQNIMLIIHMQIQQLFKVSPPKYQFIFLLQDGTVVQDFIDIPFSTSRLYFTKKQQSPDQSIKSYHKFQDIIKQYEDNCHRKGLVGRLRSHFRKQIVANKFNEDSINYDSDFSSKEKQRKISLKRAMMILEKKKNNQTHKTLIVTTSYRRKSQQQLWKQQNVEDSQYHEILTDPLIFHVNVNNSKLESEIRGEFKRYNELSCKDSKDIGQNEVFLYILQKHHPKVKALMSNTFHSLKGKRIFQILTNQKLSDDVFLSKATIPWRAFLELEILTSRNISKLIELPDCLQLTRNFVQTFLEISNEDYHRDELTSKLYRMIEGDSSTLMLMEEVIWSWLTHNGFIKRGTIQKELLWIYGQRSKVFYLLINSMILGTYDTTPLDLAYQLLI